jgi:hypothetical protein
MIRLPLIIFLFLFILVCETMFSQTLVVTDDPAYATGHASSVLDVKSSTKGFLAPRMIQSERSAISSPSAGLLVYQTDGAYGFYFWNGTSWNILTTGIGTQWSTNGNYIYYNTGNVGIGTSVPAESLEVNGNLKIGSTTTGTIRATNELVLRQDGDVYGPSILRLRNRNAENGAIFETTDASITLIDFIFKNALHQRNIRFESRAASARTGSPSFHIGGSSPDNPTLSLGDNYAAFSKYVRIGDYTTPLTALDVNGQITLRTGASAGAILISNTSGTGTWTSILPVSNGGTGSSVTNYVDLATDQTVAGAKTWSSLGTFNLGLRLPHGTGPAVPVNGDLWTTTAGVFARINGGTVGPFGTGTGNGTVTGVTATAPVVSSGGTAPIISMAAATTTVNGYLTSTNWNTFNGKENVLTFTSPLSRTTNAISMPAASSSVNGYLTSTDWTNFNGKLALAGGTMTGKLNTVVSSTTTAGLNLPHGAAPTTPVNGDIWTTTAGIYTRINSTTVGLLAASGSNTIVKTSVTVTNNTNITTAVSLPLTITVTGAALNASVIVNPRTPLANRLGIGYSYVSAANTVTINIICTNGTLQLGTVTFDISIIQ